MGTRRLELEVRGLVQGVFFRASTREQARRLGLTGWVRNRPDGSVTIVAEGPREALTDLAAWCRSGPAHARVETVRANWTAPTGEWTRFEVEH